VAASSGSTYESSRLRFVAFGAQVLGLPAEEVLPTAPGAELNKELVCLFIAHATDRYSRSTIEGTLSALADWQRSRGVPSNECVRCDPEVKAALSGALRALPYRSGGGGSAPAVKSALPLPVCRALVGYLAKRADEAPAEADECALDACWLVLGFFGLLRRSELLGIQVGHVRELGADGGIELFLPRSKTDQRGEGAFVALASVSGSGVPISRIVRRFLGVARRRGAPVTAPLLARLVGTSGWGQGLGKAEFSRRLRQRLIELQERVPQLHLDLRSLSSHSLRKGGATAAADAGVSIGDIQLHGRWRSNAVFCYTGSARRARLRVVEAM
jgi:hypothetical protein